jgi:CrcB protein
MKNLLMIAFGGALGAMCRYWLVNLINSKERIAGFPLGTISVNIIGSFCIGIIYVIIVEKVSIHPDWRNVVMVGFLAAFTTFSTFSLETISLMEQGYLANAALYVGGSVLMGVFACWLGLTLTRCF